MSGNATLTIVASMNAMKTPSEDTSRTAVGVTECRRRTPLLCSERESTAAAVAAAGGSSCVCTPITYTKQGVARKGYKHPDFRRPLLRGVDAGPVRALRLP